MSTNEEELEKLFDGITPKQLEAKVKDEMENFNGLLDSLSTAHDKKKALWRQIYDNAVTDRRNSYIMFTDLYTQVHGHTSEHAIHGATLAKYMERLNKANEQLIKLAEIIDDAVNEDEDEITDESSMYDRLEQADH